MKKSPKGEVVLSSGQIQAARLNQLEYERLERQVSSLKEDLDEQLAQIQREQQVLRLHFRNVVRVIKPNRPYDLWKQRHAGDAMIESFKGQQRPQKPTISSTIGPPDKPLRPLLLLVEDPSKKPVNPTINFLQLKSSPINKHPLAPQRVNIPDTSTSASHRRSSSSRRINPLLNMLSGRPISSNIYQQRKSSQYESRSYPSFLSRGTPSSRKLLQGQYVTNHRQSDLDALYRIALQNQTAYKSVEQTRIEDRKLHDKEFASQHRALKGSMRSASVMN